ncbi:hypothetical protein GALMADRAFT_240147 [Galerina marginata CBS 339.88]|uniref:DUF6593 domain-containing protein n=1 Tax=Galerina marginata (strain CBS 339.88) TaxID=685588 RepID=A0A067TPP4_GALM3|nr:hypothetical protein GALMADRAFT_240147 [Galerina marginata CBS 339.88]
MDLYLVPNNPENTLLVSANGVAHYQVQTITTSNGTPVTFIQRPGASPEDRIVAEIEWKDSDTPTIIRSPLFSGVGQCVGTQGIGVQASNYLYKRHRFGP